jgi:MYXO-CTERM domain-containing protein
MAGALIIESNGSRFFSCSATLIAPDVVLTAGHCVDPEAIQSAGWQVNPDTMIFGFTRSADVRAYDGGGTDWPSDVALSLDFVAHPQWSLRGLGVGLSLNYDIGLIFLDEALEDGPFSYLPTGEEAGQLEEGDDVIAVGWGMTSATNYNSAGVKQQGVSTVGELSDYEIHVGPDTEDVRKCHGDSGGPSFLEVESESTEPLRQVGITSHAYDSTDCTQTGGVDTRVDYYLEWIDEELRDRCDDGSRVWCEEPGILAAPVPASEAAEGFVPPDDLLSDVQLLGCASTPGGAPGGAPWGGLSLAWLSLVAVGRRRR